MTKRRWWVCPECGRWNWLDRLTYPPQICSRCGVPGIQHSFWKPEVRRWILQRDNSKCVFEDESLRMELGIEELGTCAGLVQVIHLRFRQHGGKLHDPTNGITVCQRHADFLIYGRMKAREDYGLSRHSFELWHREFLCISWARLPKKIRELRLILMGIAWERTQKKIAWDERRKKLKQRAKRASRG